jgi:hypothetical protein
VPVPLPKTRALAAGVASRALRRDAVILAGRGLAVGAACGTAAVVVGRVAGLLHAEPARWAAWLLIPSVLGAGVGVVAAWARRWSLPRAAREADRALSLRDQLGSALAFEQLGTPSPQAALAMAQAEAVAARARPAEVVPFRGLFTAPAWTVAPVLLALGVAAGLWLPVWRWGGRTSRPLPPAGPVTVSQVTTLTTQVREQAAGSPDPIAQRHAQAAAQIERELADGGLSDDQARARAAALSDLAADDLHRHADRALRGSDDLRAALARAAARDDAPADPLTRALRDGRLDLAADQIDRLREQLDQLPPEDRARRAAEWREYADALRQIQNDAPPAGERPMDTAVTPDPQGTPGEPSADAARSAPAPTPPNAPRDHPEVGDGAPKPESPPDAAARDKPADATPSATDAARRLADALRRGADALEGKPPADRPAGADRPPDTPRGTPPDTSGSKPEGSPESPRSSSRPTQNGPSERPPQRPDASPPNSRETPPGDRAPSDQSPSQPPSPNEAQRPAPRDDPSQPGAAPEAPAQAPRDNPRDRSPDDASMPARSPRPGDNQPSPDSPDSPDAQRLRDLAEQFRNAAGQADRARRAQQDAARLREQGRRLLDTMSDQERSRLADLARRLGNPRDELSTPPAAGGGDAPGRSPGLTLLPSPDTAGVASQPVDARGEGGPEGQRPIAEWMGGPRHESDSLPAGTPAQELRRAAQGAERAVEQQAVPPAYGDLVRRVFRRYVDRARPASPR